MVSIEIKGRYPFAYRLNSGEIMFAIKPEVPILGYIKLFPARVYLAVYGQGCKENTED
jgi:hypothetical protein